MIKGVIIVNAHGQARLVKIYNNEVRRLISDLFVTRLWRCPLLRSSESGSSCSQVACLKGAPPFSLDTRATTLLCVWLVSF